MVLLLLLLYSLVGVFIHLLEVEGDVGIVSSITADLHLARKETILGKELLAHGCLLVGGEFTDLVGGAIRVLLEEVKGDVAPDYDLDGGGVFKVHVWVCDLQRHPEIMHSAVLGDRVAILTLVLALGDPCVALLGSARLVGQVLAVAIRKEGAAGRVCVCVCVYVCVV